MFEPLTVSDNVPTNDRAEIARWAEANGLRLLDVAKVLARTVDTEGNVGMDLVRHLIEAINGRDIEHVDPRENYDEALFRLVRSGRISDEGLRELIAFAAVDSRNDTDPAVFDCDFEKPLAGECECGALYWYADNCCQSCGMVQS